LQLIEEETVVPVVGRDLLTVQGADQPALLYPRLADKLAELWSIPARGLPPKGELPEIARRYLAEGNARQNLYRDLRTTLDRLEPLSIPEPLERLVKIRQFNLFVTTTIDSLLERALDRERFDAQRQTLVFAYAPNDKQDLPREFDRLKRPAVFHLMGRVSGTPKSYAVTEEDTLEFLHSLQTKAEDSPNYLFDKLKKSNVLVIGCELHDWFVRTLMGSDRAWRFAVNPGDAPVLLIQRLGRGVHIYRGDGESFVDELYRRWAEDGPEDPLPPPPTGLASFDAPGVQPGIVFLSYASADDRAARSILDGLDRAGIDVVADRDDADLSDRWERKLRSVLNDCSVFIPVVSRRASGAERRFSRPEWIEAILAARDKSPSDRFVLPVVVDGTQPGESTIPEALGDVVSETLPAGKLTPRFIETIVKMQRSYRSAVLP